MKRFFFLFSFAITALFVHAGTALNLQLKDGIVISFLFSEKPSVTYLEDKVIIITNSAEVQYPVSNVESFTFSDSTSAIESVSIQHENLGVTSVYDISGRLIYSEKDGNLNIDQVGKGTYIIKNNKDSYKIIKK